MALGVIFALLSTSLVSFYVLCLPLLTISCLESFDLDLHSRNRFFGYGHLCVGIVCHWCLLLQCGNMSPVFGAYVRVFIDLC